MLNKLLKDYNPKHSRYQISNYIIALNGRTTYGQYKQVLREIFPRVNNIAQAIAEIKIIEHEIELAKEPNFEKINIYPPNSMGAEWFQKEYCTKLRSRAPNGKIVAPADAY
jgi:hypothetical protein